jgi:hypothetical protein
MRMCYKGASVLQANLLVFQDFRYYYTTPEILLLYYNIKLIRLLSYCLSGRYYVINYTRLQNGLNLSSVYIPFQDVTPQR